jgi:hypothetical protein
MVHFLLFIAILYDNFFTIILQLFLNRQMHLKR